MWFLGRVVILDTVCFKNFDEIVLMKSFYHSKIQNGRHFWQVKHSLKLGKASLHRSLWFKNCAEFALSGTVFEIQAFLCFAFFAKNSKIQNGHHFWQDKIFLETESPTQQRLPCGSKISSKSLYLARFLRYKHFCALHF